MVSRLAGPFTAVALSLAAAAPAFAADVVNVCSRSAPVQSFLTAKLGKTCDLITDADLATVKRMAIRNPALTTFNPADFADLPNLEILNLNETGFTTLPPAAFANLPSLKTLVLIHVSLTGLPEDFLVGADKLEGLLLFRDAFTTIPEGIIERIGALPSLKILQLGTNLDAGLQTELTAKFPAGGRIALTFHD